MTFSRRTVIKNMLLAVPALKVPFLLKDGGLTESDKLLPVTGESTGPDNRFRIYTRLLDPREHPDYNRHHVKPPTWETFDNRVHFTILRMFPIKDNKLVDYVQELDKHTKTHELGDIIWPYNDILRTENLPDLVAEIKKRNLFLFDIWGYVPGSGKGMWQQFKLEPAAAKTLEQLGDHWLGMDNGEQDGRYTGYARQEYPIHKDDRLHHYFHFQRHFERLTTDLGNRMATLVSLNYGHYFLKEGLYTMIGAETAQGLPNSQVYYAFIRGASKQYGVPWFGNASVFNRWEEYKHYETEGDDHGPRKGTSLSLLKRLIYSHILYNSMIVGFELSWFLKEEKNKPAELSPVGRIQQGAVQWSRKYGQPGSLITPIAILVDFFSGWSFPRHLYATTLYRVWGNLPYEAGDFLTDGVLDMLYPGYQNSSFYHDESGFLSPTPYGDSADCLLSDAEEWLLNRYAVLVVAGALAGGQEIRNKLDAYAAGGGHLIITAGSLSMLPNGLAGIQVVGAVTHFPAGQTVQWANENRTEKEAFDVYPLTVPKTAQVLAKVGVVPVVLEIPHGKGKITVLSSPFGVGSAAVSPIPVLKTKYELDDKPLVKPFPLLNHVLQVLDTAFKAQQLFEIDDQLTLITCRKGPGEYTLGVTNNTWEPHPLNIVSHCGAIESIKEMPVDQSEKKVIEYLPMPLQGRKMEAGKGALAGGDVRIFSVRVKEKQVDDVTSITVVPRSTLQFPSGWDALSDDGFTQYDYGTANSISISGPTPTTSGYVNDVYTVNYQGIAAINNFLANIGKVTLDDASRAKYVAEVSFLRAFFYFQLATLYGNVILIKEPATETFKSPRPNSTREEVLAFVNEDLDKAIAALPDAAYTDGHIVKGSALAMKARVLLYQKKYAEAAALSKTVIDAKKQSLAVNYATIFYKPGQNNNPEIIFSIKNLPPNSYPEVGVDLFQGGWQNIQPTSDLINEYESKDGLPISTSPLYNAATPYENRDPRLRMTIFVANDGAAQGWTYNATGIFLPFKESNTIGFALKKMLDPTRPQPDYATQSDQDYVLIRFAEVLLNYAEAENEANGPANAYGAINQIRARVGMPALPAGLSKETMRDRIRHERRIELAFEGFRYYDLRRWGIAVQKLNGFEIVPGNTNLKKKVYESRFDLWPLPQTEIDRNPGAKQNTGY